MTNANANNSLTSTLLNRKDQEKQQREQATAGTQSTAGNSTGGLVFKESDYPLNFKTNRKGDKVAAAPARMKMRAVQPTPSGDEVLIDIGFGVDVDPTGRALPEGFKLDADTANMYHLILQKMKSEGQTTRKIRVTMELEITLSKEDKQAVDTSLFII